MRNYISVNAKYYKAKEINRIINHNLRIDDIEYLLKKEDIKFENNNIIYGSDLYTVGEYENEKLLLKNEYNLDKKNNSNLFNRQYLNLHNAKKDIQAKKKSFTKPSENELVEMVIALSEEQALHYLSNGIDITKGFDNFAKDLQDKYGFTPLQLSLHTDEGYIDENGVVKFNIHCHLTLFNYDFIKERSVLRTLTKQDWIDMQDMAQNSFQAMGLDFVRGVSKSITKKEHLEKNDYILQKQTTKINSLKNDIYDINKQKNDSKELLKNFEKGTIEYGELYKEIGKLQVNEKSLREEKRKLEGEIIVLNDKKDKLDLNDVKDFTKTIDKLQEKVDLNSKKDKEFKDEVFKFLKSVLTIEKLGEMSMNDDTSDVMYNFLIDKLANKDINIMDILINKDENEEENEKKDINWH